jgi:hypothetical protein
MRKKIIPLTVLVVCLLTSSFAWVQTVQASPMVTVDKPWWRTTGVNQPVEFTASAKGGTPPYTFQWYTTFLDPTVPSGQWHTVMVPDSNSSTFKFAASTTGRYGISIRLSDSKGIDEYQSFQPMGIVVTVQSSPVPQPTRSPSLSPTPSPPNISLSNYENKTFTENSIPLNFTLSKTAQWIGYSLDGQANITINGNTTIAGLSNGLHTITAYANDTFGDVALHKPSTSL